MAGEITEQSMRRNPVGGFFCAVEATLIELANSLSEAMFA
jgi:hypothetical protein